jgi:cobaltochelatase CobN
MSRISGSQSLTAVAIGLLAIVILTAPHAMADSVRQKTPSPQAEAASGPRLPPRKKALGEPIRLAVLTTAVHTPILVRAYDQFRAQHGTERLTLDLWVEQEWTDAPRPLDFKSYDMVLALRCSIPGLEKALATAAAEGVWVVSDSNAKHREYAAAIDEAPDLAPYYRKRGVANMVGLLEKVCSLFGVPDVQPRAPAEPPTEGIYHPDADRVFPDADSYWKWYATRPVYKADAPKVGIFVYNTLYLNEETDYFTQLVRGLEQAGANPILGFWFLTVDGSATAVSPISRFFAGVDVLLTSSFRLINEKPHHEEEIQKLNVPVLNSIILNITADEWRQSRQGLPASYLLPGIVAPELSGLIEPTVIATRQPVDNPQTKQRYFRTVVLDENYQWQIRRALAWARLRRTQPADRRIAILFYNHSGGKQNIGASYLNVTASLSRILTGLGQHGYRVEGSIDRQAILDSMQSVGRNVGTWAPGEVDRLVEKGAVLWPLEEYLAHYDRLPEKAKRQISQQWGQPPGDIMTVTREGRQYFVLPAFQMGNVLLAPQPARASAQKAAALYHDPLTWPTHQYLAFHFWLRHHWQAHAVVHLGRHGTLEFLPGKSTGLGAHDPPAIVLGDLPNIYPYIVDGIGEAVAAKRRGQAVLLTHATPPLTGTRLYGQLAKLQELTNRYGHARDQKQSGLQTEYYQSIVKLAAELGYDLASAHEHGPATESASDNATNVEDREVSRIEHWLAEIEAQSGPRGLHTFGEAYSQQATEDMLPRMFADELATLRKAGLKPEEERTWLAAAARAESSQPSSLSEPAEMPSGPKQTVAHFRSRIEATAWHMRHNQELDFLVQALDGRFIPVGPPGDPLSNPDIFPTGRNQYQHNPAKLPTREAWAIGKRMAEQTLALHRRRYGSDPSKLSVTLWANTLIRTHGVLESEILHLLGLEPVWNQRGDVTDVRLATPLGRPRIDVVMTVTGMYRDCFPDKVLLLDKAVRLAHDAPPEAGLANHVALNTQKIAQELKGSGTDAKTSQRLALLRIFGAQTGQYGTGVGARVNASERGTRPAEIANQYLTRMSFAYSNDGWSQPAAQVFQSQLRGVQAVVHGRSSNLYGIMDLTENFEYQGALALAVEQLDGRQPDLYVDDLVHGQQVLSGREAITLELLSRYQNPEFVTAMKAEGYDGAKYFSRIADNQFGWDVVSDVITADDWKRYAEIYLEDKFQLGMREFFDQQNPHALQNIASRILETHRTGLQKLDPKTLELAACAYVETVAQHGAACASHICANPELATLAEKLAGASHKLADGALERFRAELQQVGNAAMTKPPASTGASNQAARVPQPVEGHVLTASSLEPRHRPTKESASSAPPPAATKTASPAPQTASPDMHEAKSKTHQLPTFLAAVLCVVAFVFGLLWRAAGNRRTR